MKKEEEFCGIHVGIIGAGIVGLAAAVALRRAGLDVEVCMYLAS